MESELLVAAVIYRADDADIETLPVTIELARQQLQAADSPCQVEEVVADKGYHKGETLQTVQDVQGVRTYIPEQKYRGRRRWQDKPAEQQGLVYANRRRVRGRRGRRLGRLRSERVERSFAHMCVTGGGRRALAARCGQRLEELSRSRSGAQSRGSSCWRCSGSGLRAACKVGWGCFSPSSWCCSRFSCAVPGCLRR